MKNMRKYAVCSFLICLFGLSACYEDDSSMGSDSVSDITIMGLEDMEGQSIVSYAGNRLQCSPVIQSGYADGDLAVAWYLFNTSAEETPNGYQDFLISTDRNLDYEINLPPGTYRLVCEVSSLSNGLVKTATVDIMVATLFSNGFYVLKETPEGTTELDLYNENGLTQDLMADFAGGALAGSPRNLSVIYEGEFIDPETNETARGNLVHVMTEDNVYKGFKAETMTEVFNNENLFYGGPMDANEQPALFFMTMFYNCYASNTGIRIAQVGGDTPGTGKLPYPSSDGASKYLQIHGMDVVYWNDASHRLERTDYNINTVSPEDCGEYPGGMECISSGRNDNVGRIYFLCEEPATGDRYLFLYSIPMFMQTGFDQVLQVDPSTHLAKSRIISGNSQTGSYIYCVGEDHKLYVYNYEEGTETEVPLPGIDNGEEITYVSNPFLNIGFGDTSANFDALVVATRKGNGYKLYIYDEGMVGGMPTKAPEVVAEGGNGVVRCVRYLSPVTVDKNDLFSTYVYSWTD